MSLFSSPALPSVLRCSETLRRISTVMPPLERTRSAPDHNNPYREALLCSSPRSVMGSNQVISRGSALVELWRGVPLRGSCVGPKKAQCYLTDCGKGGFRLDRLQTVSCKHSGDTTLRARYGQTR